MAISFEDFKNKITPLRHKPLDVIDETLQWSFQELKKRHNVGAADAQKDVPAKIQENPLANAIKALKAGAKAKDPNDQLLSNLLFLSYREGQKTSRNPLKRRRSIKYAEQLQIEVNKKQQTIDEGKLKEVVADFKKIASERDVKRLSGLFGEGTAIHQALITEPENVSAVVAQSEASNSVVVEKRLSVSREAVARVSRTPDEALANAVDEFLAAYDSDNNQRRYNVRGPLFRIKAAVEQGADFSRYSNLFDLFYEEGKRNSNGNNPLEHALNRAKYIPTEEVNKPVIQKSFRLGPLSHVANHLTSYSPTKNSGAKQYLDGLSDFQRKLAQPGVPMAVRQKLLTAKSASVQGTVNLDVVQGQLIEAYQKEMQDFLGALGDGSRKTRRVGVESHVLCVTQRVGLALSGDNNLKENAIAYVASLGVQADKAKALVDKLAEVNPAILAVLENIEASIVFQDYPLVFTRAANFLQYDPEFAGHYWQRNAIAVQAEKLIGKAIIGLKDKTVEAWLADNRDLLFREEHNLLSEVKTDLDLLKAYNANKGINDRSVDDNVTRVWDRQDALLDTQEEIRQEFGREEVRKKYKTLRDLEEKQLENVEVPELDRLFMEGGIFSEQSETVLRRRAEKEPRKNAAQAAKEAAEKAAQAAEATEAVQAAKEAAKAAQEAAQAAKEASQAAKVAEPAQAARAAEAVKAAEEAVQAAKEAAKAAKEAAKEAAAAEAVQVAKQATLAAKEAAHTARNKKKELAPKEDENYLDPLGMVELSFASDDDRELAQYKADVSAFKERLAAEFEEEFPDLQKSVAEQKAAAAREKRLDHQSSSDIGTVTDRHALNADVQTPTKRHLVLPSQLPAAIVPDVIRELAQGTSVSESHLAVFSRKLQRKLPNLFAVMTATKRGLDEDTIEVVTLFKEEIQSALNSITSENDIGDIVEAVFRTFSVIDRHVHNAEEKELKPTEHPPLSPDPSVGTILREVEAMPTPFPKRERPAARDMKIKEFISLLENERWVTKDQIETFINEVKTLYPNIVSAYEQNRVLTPQLQDGLRGCIEFHKSGLFEEFSDSFEELNNLLGVTRSKDESEEMSPFEDLDKTIRDHFSDSEEGSPSVDDPKIKAFQAYLDGVVSPSPKRVSTEDQALVDTSLQGTQPVIRPLLNHTESELALLADIEKDASPQTNNGEVNLDTLLSTGQDIPLPGTAKVPEQEFKQHESNQENIPPAQENTPSAPAKAEIPKPKLDPGARPKNLPEGQRTVRFNLPEENTPLSQQENQTAGNPSTPPSTPDRELDKLGAALNALSDGNVTQRFDRVRQRSALSKVDQEKNESYLQTLQEELENQPSGPDIKLPEDQGGKQNQENPPVEGNVDEEIDKIFGDFGLSKKADPGLSEPVKKVETKAPANASEGNRVPEPAVVRTATRFKKTADASSAKLCIEYDETLMPSFAEEASGLSFKMVDGQVPEHLAEAPAHIHQNERLAKSWWIGQKQEVWKEAHRVEVGEFNRELEALTVAQRTAAIDNEHHRRQRIQEERRAKDRTEVEEAPKKPVKISSVRGRDVATEREQEHLAKAIVVYTYNTLTENQVRNSEYLEGEAGSKLVALYKEKIASAYNAIIAEREQAERSRVQLLKDANTPTKQKQIMPPTMPEVLGKVLSAADDVVVKRLTGKELNLEEIQDGIERWVASVAVGNIDPASEAQVKQSEKKRDEERQASEKAFATWGASPSERKEAFAKRAQTLGAQFSKNQSAKSRPQMVEDSFTRLKSKVDEVQQTAAKTAVPSKDSKNTQVEKTTEGVAPKLIDVVNKFIFSMDGKTASLNPKMNGPFRAEILKGVQNFVAAKNNIAPMEQNNTPVGNALDQLKPSEVATGIFRACKDDKEKGAFARLPKLEVTVGEVVGRYIDKLSYDRTLENQHEFVLRKLADAMDIEPGDIASRQVGTAEGQVGLGNITKAILQSSLELGEKRKHEGKDLRQIARDIGKEQIDAKLKQKLVRDTNMLAKAQWEEGGKQGNPPVPYLFENISNHYGEVELSTWFTQALTSYISENYPGKTAEQVYGMLGAAVIKQRSGEISDRIVEIHESFYVDKVILPVVEEAIEAARPKVKVGTVIQGIADKCRPQLIISNDQLLTKLHGLNGSRAVPRFVLNNMDVGDGQGQVKPELIARATAILTLELKGVQQTPEAEVEKLSTGFLVRVNEVINESLQRNR